MPDSKTKKNPVKRTKKIELEVDNYRKLVYKIRKSKNQDEINDAFKKISDSLEIKIKKIAGKFRIPGLSFEDVFQECLYALQYKAIKDYDENRGAVAGEPAAFDRFALMCVKRHLSTVLKISHQNRKRILNESKSLDQDRGNATDNNEDLSLINIVKSKDFPMLENLEIKEFVRNFSNKLTSKLTSFEQDVFFMYVKKHSYEEIANEIIGRYDKKSVKSIDNGLSRIKNKSWEIYLKMVENGQVPDQAMKWFNLNANVKPNKHKKKR